MKLLNFANLEFEWGEEKEIRCDVFYVDLACKFKYWFYYPSSYYFRIKPNIKWRKRNYRHIFINQVKHIKKIIKNETT